MRQGRRPRQAATPENTRVLVLEDSLLAAEVEVGERGSVSSLRTLWRANVHVSTAHR